MSKIDKFSKMIEIFSNDLEWSRMIKYDIWKVTRCSTSLPGGNQVDGLPPVPSRVQWVLAAAWSRDYLWPEHLLEEDCEKLCQSFGF